MKWREKSGWGKQYVCTPQVGAALLQIAETVLQSSESSVCSASAGVSSTNLWVTENYTIHSDVKRAFLDIKLCYTHKGWVIISEDRRAFKGGHCPPVNIGPSSESSPLSWIRPSFPKRHCWVGFAHWHAHCEQVHTAVCPIHRGASRECQARWPWLSQTASIFWTNSFLPTLVSFLL